MLTLNGGASIVSGIAPSVCSSTESSGFLPTATTASNEDGAICHTWPALASFTPLIESLMLCLESDGFSTANVSVLRSSLSAALTSSG